MINSTYLYFAIKNKISDFFGNHFFFSPFQVQTQVQELGDVKWDGSQIPQSPTAFSSLSQASPGFWFLLLLVAFFVLVVCFTLWPRQMYSRNARLSARKFSRAEGLTLPIRCRVLSLEASKALSKSEIKTYREFPPETFLSLSEVRLTLTGLAIGGCNLVTQEKHLSIGQYLCIHLDSLPEFPKLSSPVLGKVIWQKPKMYGEGFSSPARCSQLVSCGIKFVPFTDSQFQGPLQNYLDHLLEEPFA